MKILVVGNMGYVGPLVVEALRRAYVTAEIHGLDTGYFSTCLTGCTEQPETRLDQQWFMDIRDIPRDFLKGYHAVIYLAAVSNDPMGERFQTATESINYAGACRFAEYAKQNGVRRFIFASSCSIYGSAGSDWKTEESKLAPITTYARTKMLFETFLGEMSAESFVVTALRFATACGASSRLRLDLVLNDFVASAHVLKKIVLLSDGKAWRPLIDVGDMAQAVVWAAGREVEDGGPFLAVNTGRQSWNFRIIDLARRVADQFDGVDIEIGTQGTDARTYRVDFGLYARRAAAFMAPRSIEQTITEIRRTLEVMEFSDENFRASRLMRLNRLQELQDEGHLSESLRWTDENPYASIRTES